MKIQEQLEDIATSSNFFEEEKRRQAEKRDQERAQNIRDALAFGEPVSTRDQNWLTKYDEALAAGTTLVAMAAEKKAAALENMKKPAVTAENGEEISEEGSEETLEASMDESESESLDESTDGDDSELEEAVVAFDNDEDLDEASDDQLFADSDDESSEEEELPFLGEADDIDEEGEASV